MGIHCFSSFAKQLFFGVKLFLFPLVPAMIFSFFFQIFFRLAPHLYSLELVKLGLLIEYEWLWLFTYLYCVFME